MQRLGFNLEILNGVEVKLQEGQNILFKYVTDRQISDLVNVPNAIAEVDQPVEGSPVP